MPKALITGITGQDGAYLARLLLEKGYVVSGFCRLEPDAEIDALRILGVADQVEIIRGDLTDPTAVRNAVKGCQPDEIYNLASQSSISRSWTHPLETAQVTGLGVANVLEALRLEQPTARFFQASSSDMFGPNGKDRQSEDGPFTPRTPYGAAKLYGHVMTQSYRQQYSLHASSGILFNHESPLRPPSFVTRKITSAAARIKGGSGETLSLGNLDVERDWGHARDYVDAMWLMLQQPGADDYVIATGNRSSVRTICEIAFGHLGLRLEDHIRIDPQFVRPNEPAMAVGDPGKVRRMLNWTAKVSLEEMIVEMVEADLRQLSG